MSLKGLKLKASRVVEGHKMLKSNVSRGKGLLLHIMGGESIPKLGQEKDGETLNVLEESHEIFM